jgi:HEAT repeat protein
MRVLRDLRAVDPLVGALQDEIFRAYAADALAKLGDKRAIDRSTHR